MKQHILLILLAIIVNTLHAQYSFSAFEYVKIEKTQEDPLSLDALKPSKMQPHKLALIIGNENYRNTFSVPYAKRDAAAFNAYAKHLLGIDSSNIVYIENGSSLEIEKGIQQIVALQQLIKDSTEIIFYYAGHGMPQNEGQVILLPVDVHPIDLIGGIELTKAANELKTSKTKQVTILLDACFTGKSRTKNLMASRGIIVVPKYNNLPENTFVLSASSDDQKAHPMDQYQHGAFTYYLLLTLKEENGLITLEALSQKVTKKVEKWSIKAAEQQSPNFYYNSKTKSQNKTL